MAGANAKVFLTAPAGTIASRAGARLTERGQNISVLALERSVARLPDSVREAAEIHIGTMDNEHDIINASRGASAMLLVLPPVLTADDVVGSWERQISNSLAAIEANGIGRVVFISSQGAAADGPSILRLSYEVEERLRAAVPHVRSLRIGPLMENLFIQTKAISQGTLVDLCGPDTRTLAYLAADDLGDVLADLLSDDSWSGSEVNVVRGPKVFTPREAAERISAGLGRDIAFVQIAKAELVKEIADTGIARGAAQAIADVFEAAGKVEYVDDDPTARIGPTPLDKFVRTSLAPVIAAANSNAR